MIVDDVITAGTAIREALELLTKSNAKVVAVTVCIDRQERASEYSTESAIQQVEKTYGFPVISVVQLKDLIAYVENELDTKLSDENKAIKENQLLNIKKYRESFGVEY